MRTIKIKLTFSPKITELERRTMLLTWASKMLKKNTANILEEKHLERMSYIVVGREMN